METIYTLELENGKYYVGLSNNPERRIERHMNGNGSEWTKLYKPIKILDTHEKQSNFDEDNTTKQMMMKYGIENVRGGSYCKIELEEWQIKSLECEFKNVSNVCYKCGKSSHYAFDCSNNIDKYMKMSVEELEQMRDKQIEKLTELKEIDKQIIKYEINFGDFKRQLGTLGQRCINIDLNLITLPLTIDFEEKIHDTLNRLNRHIKYPENYNKPQIDVAKNELEQAIRIFITNIKYEIHKLSKDTLNFDNKFGNNDSDKYDKLKLKQLLINNKKLTNKLNELLGKKYKNFNEAEKDILTDIGDIIDAILYKLGE
jgi:predicted GIY-YIG superfamily endonuclease